MSYKKITSFQFLTLLILSLSSVGVFFTSVRTEFCVGNAGWLVPLINFIPLCALLFLNYRYDFATILEQQVNRRIYKFLCTVYAVWTAVFSASKVYIFATRLTNGTLYYMPALLLCAILLFTVGVCLFFGYGAFAKTTQVLFIVFCIVVSVILFLSLRNVDFKNLLPVTVYDLPNALKNCIYTTANTALLFYFSFIPHEKAGKRTHMFITAGAVTLIFLLTVVMEVGVLRSDIAKSLIFPFFAAIKATSNFGSLEHMEALFISVWTVTDFALCAGLLSSSLICIIRAFPNSRKYSKPISAILVLIVFILCTVMEKAHINVTRIDKSVSVVINLILGIVIPIVVSFTAFVRERRGKGTQKD